MTVFCLIGACGAIVAAGLSGHIAVYIMSNRNDVNNTICHPEVYYPPIFTDEDAEEDCEFERKILKLQIGFNFAFIQV